MDQFAPFVRTLGRGPGRSRALTRQEAREAFAMVLAGEVDPHQLGAFLMLLRYRGEDPDEITGLVEAARDHLAATAAAALRPDLDWPSYGSGRTRGAPWYLLAALALASGGRRVLMHGTNEFTGGLTVERGLAAIGRAPAASADAAARGLDASGFAYLPLARLSPVLDRLIGLRALFGLRSPINTVGRLLDPGDASRSVDGVFHPPYIALHLGVARRLARARLVVVKGGGGEAERAPGKALAVHVHDRDRGDVEWQLPPLLGTARVDPAQEDAALFADVWSGARAPEAPVATVIGTIALALLALDPGLAPERADPLAAAVWAARHGG